MHVKICKVIQPISHVRIYIARAHECIHIYGIFLVINLKQFRNSSLKKSAIFFLKIRIHPICHGKHYTHIPRRGNICEIYRPPILHLVHFKFSLITRKKGHKTPLKSYSILNLVLQMFKGLLS